TPWIARHLPPPERPIDRVILPGLCSGDPAEVERVAGAPVERGPRDLRDLPDYFRTGSSVRVDYGAFDTSILAEINHAPRLELRELLALAHAYRAAGADLIDVGCDPGSTWAG